MVKIDCILSVIVPLAFAACACAVPDEPNNASGTYFDSLVYSDANTSIYLCSHEWTGILLSTSDPHTLVSNTRWTVPTKSEAVVLHTVALSAVSNQRYLAYDNATATYYSFCFNGDGTVSKAGTKTKYTLRPVRVVTIPKDTIITL